MTTSLAAGSELADIAAKVAAGERLTHDDGVRLYRSRDLATIGELANTVRERLHGRRAFYNVNLHVNYTNFCVLRCRFCSFYRPYPKDGAARPAPAAGSATRTLPIVADDAEPDAGTNNHDGYELSVEQIVERARAAYEHGATEVHIVGGLHPRLPFSYYEQMCRSIRDACPRMHIKAFTAIEIIHFTRIAKPRLRIEDVLHRLRDAGLGSLPGGGAEIFDERVHEEAFRNKVGEAGWFDVHRAAHEMGMYTNATMLYGHVETPEERVGHLLKLREHQDASLHGRPAGFNCVIPLSFIPDGSALADRPGPTGVDDLKTLAISRLLLDNVPHVKAFWIMQSPKLAQVSLNWGVDDFDGTVVYYDITKREGRGTHQELPVERLRRLIIEAGCEPVERDTLYRRVVRANGDWTTEPLPAPPTQRDDVAQNTGRPQQPDA